MIAKTIDTPIGRIKFARRRSPLGQQRRMRLEDYARAASLPTPPTLVDYAPKAALSLRNILGNDQEGNCVIAGGYHVEGVATGNAGPGAVPYVPSRAALDADYGAIGGFVPGDPSTDNGCDMATAIAYWTRHGFANGTKLLGALKLNPGDPHELMLALWLFENLYVGAELPDAWIDPFPDQNGFVWPVAGPSDPQNGHCFMMPGYSSAGLKIDTWGLLGTLPWDAAAKYLAASNGGECYALLTPDILLRGQQKAPSGFDWAALVADFDAMGGNVPVPTPVPAPPSPTGVTLEQAEAWAMTGVRSRMPHILAAAQQAAAAGLAAASKTLEQQVEQAARDGLAGAWPR